MEKIEFKNNSEPYLSAENLNQIQTNAENAINEVYKKNIYSTDEHIVGIWMNGKPIYRKVIIYTGTLSGGSNLIEHGITNFDEIISAKGYTKYHNIYYLMGALESASNFINIKTIDSTQVSIHIGSGWESSFSSSGCTLVLEYTKTID